MDEVDSLREQLAAMQQKLNDLEKVIENQKVEGESAAANDTRRQMGS